MPFADLPFLPALSPAPDSAPALCDDSGTWIDYGSLRAQVSALAIILKSTPRGLIFCCVPRSVDGALAYLGAAASGHAVGLCDEAMPHLSSLVDAYEPEWLVVASNRSFDGYEALKCDLKGLQLLRRSRPADSKLHPDFYLLLLTSGSTGSSKTVRLSYANLASNTRAIIESLNLTSAACAFNHLPLHYSFGLSVLHSQMAIGGSCILTALSMMNKEFWKLAREQKASLFPGVPYHYEMLAKLGLNRIDCPDFDIFLQAGGKLSDELTRELWQQIAQRRGKFFVMYGQTEASPRISCLAVHEHQGKIGTCGKVLAGGTLAIEDGEVIYTGPNVMMGYAKNRADVAKGDDMHGKLRTGDMGTLQDGYLIITGRRQRFAKLFGQRIALENIEAIVGKVAPTIAIEKADRIVLATTAQNDTYEKIGKLVETETSLSSTWFEIRHIDTIPRNSNGKVDYCKLREML